MADTFCGLPCLMLHRPGHGHAASPRCTSKMQVCHLWKACVKSRNVISEHFASMTAADVHTFKQSPSLDESGTGKRYQAVSGSWYCPGKISSASKSENPKRLTWAQPWSISSSRRNPCIIPKERGNRLNIAFVYDERTWAFEPSRSCLNMIKKQTGPRGPPFC